MSVASTSSVAAEHLIMGLPLEAAAAAGSCIIALFSLGIATAAWLASARSERELRQVRKDEYTDKILREHDGPEMVACRKWVLEGIRNHAIQQRCHVKGGLTQMNVGPTFPIDSPDGTKDLQGGQISLKVLRFYGRVATAVTEQRIDNERVVDHMADDLIACWSALTPWLRHKTVGDYYRWFRRRYSMGSLAEILIHNERFTDRIAEMKKRPPFWAKRRKAR